MNQAQCIKFMIVSILLVHHRLCFARNINLENPNIEERKIDNLAVPVGKDAVLPVDKLKIPEHIDAVKMEQNGMLNKDYKKEIFMGNHEEIDDDNDEMAESKLKDIFNKVDSDKDGELTVEEIEKWILKKVNEHFDEALGETKHVFKHLDPDGDGLVDWKEYYIHFLLAKGHPIEKATEHVKDYDVIEMEFDEREQLIRYKFKWTDADQNPVDNKLSESEFLTFRHPEQSPETLKNILESILLSLDKDEDGIITEKEFISLPMGEFDDDEQRKLDKEWQTERLKEFREQIDHNHDGKATKMELEKYLDPKNPEQARIDAENLISVMDDNHNKRIAWEEIANHKDIFLYSKIVNVKRTLHDEF